jgi:hypothetical protein
MEGWSRVDTLVNVDVLRVVGGGVLRWIVGMNCGTLIQFQPLSHRDATKHWISPRYSQTELTQEKWW